MKRFQYWINWQTLHKRKFPRRTTFLFTYLFVHLNVLQELAVTWGCASRQTEGQILHQRLQSRGTAQNEHRHHGQRQAGVYRGKQGSGRPLRQCVFRRASGTLVSKVPDGFPSFVFHLWFIIATFLLRLLFRLQFLYNFDNCSKKIFLCLDWNFDIINTCIQYCSLKLLDLHPVKHIL